MRVENKVVYSYDVPAAGERRYVALFDLYFPKVPPEALEKDNLYLRPSQKKQLLFRCKLVLTQNV